MRAMGALRRQIRQSQCPGGCSQRLSPLRYWTFGSALRGPHATPMIRQSDGFAAAASRQHSVSPLDAICVILAALPTAAHTDSAVAMLHSEPP